MSGVIFTHGRPREGKYYVFSGILETKIFKNFLQPQEPQLLVHI